jgi:hypothetical protein
MLKLVALFLLSLIASPFTAPFQTCDLADSPARDDNTVMTAPLDDNKPGTLIAPLDTESGRLKIALAGVFSQTAFETLRPLTPFARSVGSTRACSDRSTVATVLRL